MASVIFSQVKGLIGRTFILAGLAPSALVIVGIYIYLYGIQGVTVLVEQFTSESAASSIDSNLLVLSWLLVGVLFVVIRSAIMGFTVNIPGAALSPLRYYLEFRMIRQRELIFRKKEYFIYAGSAINWHKKNFSSDYFIPGFFKQPDRDSTLEDSRRARHIIEYLRDPRYSEFHLPSRFQSNAIKKGLLNLYVLGKFQSNDKEYDNEIIAWKALTQDKTSKDILEKVSESLTRAHSVVFNQFKAYPEDLWIKPTVIGNLVSALDDYSEKRYGIDTATVWPRLWYVISDSERKEVMESKFQVELLLNHMVGFLILFFFSLIVGMLSIFEMSLLQTELPWWGSLIFSVTALLLSRYAYRGAVYAFLSFKEKTTSLIDLYRHVLLNKLGYSLINVEKEIALFRELKNFFVQAVPRYGMRKIDIKKE